MFLYISGFTRNALHSAPWLHLRETALDIQAVRHKWRRLHNARRARGDRGGHPRADGQTGASGEGHGEVRATGMSGC